jgi:uncharacterized MAPEG superfamily protein
MTTDLWMLVWSSLLCVSIPFIHVGGLMQVPAGMEWGFGNRDKPFEMPAWAARAKRAHANTVENLAPFAALVLVAHVAGKANEMTALGATIFFWSRVVYVGVYTAGIPYLRTAIFSLASVGEVLILIQLFG